MMAYSGVSTFNRFQPLVTNGQGAPVNMAPVMQSTPTQQYGYRDDSPRVFENILSSDEKLSHILVKLTNMETVQGNMCRSFEAFETSMQAVNMRVDRLDTRSDVHSKMLKLLAYKSIDNEARSRRNNLIFRGITESADGRAGPVSCIETIKCFLEGEMGYENISNLPIERAHRLGQRGYYVRGQYTRPIIVAFRDFTDTEEIFSNSYRLRQTAYSIVRDYPKEIADARKRLYPKFKAARDERKKPVLKYPARLVIDGETVDDMFPDWYDTMRLDRMNMCHKLSAEPRDRNIYSTSTVNDNPPDRDGVVIPRPGTSTMTPTTAPPNSPPTIPGNGPLPGSAWEQVMNSQQQSLSAMPSGQPRASKQSPRAPTTTDSHPPDSPMTTNTSFGNQQSSATYIVADRSFADVVNRSGSTISGDRTANSPSILQPPPTHRPTNPTPGASTNCDQNNFPISSNLVNENTHARTNVNNTVTQWSRDTGSVERNTPPGHIPANRVQDNRRQDNTRDTARDSG